MSTHYCKTGRKYWSNKTIGTVIQYWVSRDGSLSDTSAKFQMSEEDIINIIDTYYQPTLKGELMSITLPSKLND